MWFSCLSVDTCYSHVKIYSLQSRKKVIFYYDPDGVTVNLYFFFPIGSCLKLNISGVLTAGCTRYFVATVDVLVLESHSGMIPACNAEVPT